MNKIELSKKRQFARAFLRDYYYHRQTKVNRYIKYISAFEMLKDDDRRILTDLYINGVLSAEAVRLYGVTRRTLYARSQRAVDRLLYLAGDLDTLKSD